MSLPYLKSSTTLNVSIAGQSLLPRAQAHRVCLCPFQGGVTLHFSSSGGIGGEVSALRPGLAFKSLLSCPLLGLFLPLCWVDVAIQEAEDGRTGFSLSLINCRLKDHHPLNQSLERNHPNKQTPACLPSKFPGFTRNPLGLEPNSGEMQCVTGFLCPFNLYLPTSKGLHLIQTILVSF